VTVEEINPNIELHLLTLRFSAPALLTSGAATTPVEDFALLYRMSTGIYGRPGLRRFDQPFAYARPYVKTLHFGSPYFLETIIPTLLIVGGIKGLPKLIPLVKQIIVEPGKARRELKENKAGRLKAEQEIIEREALLDDPESVRSLAEAKRDAEIYEAHERGLKSRAEIVQTLADLDPDTREAVIRSYGDRGLRTLYDVARRAEGGPVRPEEMSITPVEIRKSSRRHPSEARSSPRAREQGLAGSGQRRCPGRCSPMREPALHETACQHRPRPVPAGLTALASRAAAQLPLVEQARQPAGVSWSSVFHSASSVTPRCCIQVSGTQTHDHFCHRAGGRPRVIWRYRLVAPSQEPTNRTPPRCRRGSGHQRITIRLAVLAASRLPTVTTWSPPVSGVHIDAGPHPGRPRLAMPRP
jgi:hypothetical protein